MSKAAELANLIGNINAGGGGVNRNLIINGAMQCNQRGSYTITTTGSPEYGGPDRFHMWSYTSTEEVVGDVTQSTDVPSGNGFAYSRKFDVTTAESAVATGEALVMAQYIESQNVQHLEYGTSSAKAVTMSFWIKTTKTGTYCFFLQQDDGDRIYVKEYTVDVSNTWEKKIITIPGDASGTLNNDNGRGLWCGWVLMAGTDRQGTANAWRATGADYATSNQVNSVDSTSNNIYLTGVQLEVGQNATTFEHEPFERTLAKCQRYFQKNTNPGTTSYPSSGGYARGHYLFPVQMRADPAMSFTDSGSGGSAIANVTNVDGFYRTYGSLGASEAGTFTYTSAAEL